MNVCLNSNWMNKTCLAKGLWKTGIVKGKQRYKCKNCNKNQAETDSRVKYSVEERKRALVLYLEGYGFRRIARIMSKTFEKMIDIRQL